MARNSVKLHLGCGEKYWPGFVNIDFVGGDIQADILKLKFPKNYADEIHLIHVFEHLHRLQAEEAAMHWFDVLKPDGFLCLEVPCLDKIAKMICDGEKNFNYTLFGLYGDVRLGREEMLHKWCWSKKEIQQVLEKIGYIDVQIFEPIFHLPNRDMRVIAYKPN